MYIEKLSSSAKGGSLGNGKPNGFCVFESIGSTMSVFCIWSFTLCLGYIAVNINPKAQTILQEQRLRCFGYFKGMHVMWSNVFITRNPYIPSEIQQIEETAANQQENWHNNLRFN